MAKEVLEVTDADIGIDGRVNGAVPEHVRMHLEADLGFLPGPFDQAGESCGREWSAALCLEYPRSLGLALQSPERSLLIPSQRMRAGNAAFRPTDVQRGILEADVGQLLADEFRDAQTMRVADQDHGAVTQPVPVALGDFDEAADLGLGQIFPGPHFLVGRPSQANCPIY